MKNTDKFMQLETALQFIAQDWADCSALFENEIAITINQGHDKGKAYKVICEPSKLARNILDLFDYSFSCHLAALGHNNAAAESDKVSWNEGSKPTPLGMSGKFPYLNQTLNKSRYIYATKN